MAERRRKYIPQGDKPPPKKKGSASYETLPPVPKNTTARARQALLFEVVSLNATRRCLQSV